jgi:amino acid adenylation domain-containing protein
MGAAKDLGAGGPAIDFARAELESSIVARFEKIVAARGTALAVAGNGEEWSYEALDRRANQVGHAVRDRLGDGRGCVAYLVDHGPDMVIGALGILKAGKTYLCLHPHMPSAALRDIVGDAAPQLLIADERHMPVAREISGGEIPVALVEDTGAAQPSTPLGLSIDPGDPAVIFYTSGSTGRPKGVVKSHRTVLHRAWLCARYDGVSTTDRQSLLTHGSFASSEADCFGALLNGAAVELFDVSSHGFGGLGKWIDARGITLLHPPVVLFRRYLAKLEGAGLHPGVRLVALAGEAVQGSDIMQWRERFATSCGLRHRFSSTEAGHIAVACIEPFESVAPDAMPLSLAVEDKILGVIDGPDSDPAEFGTGELVVRSAFLADGYWRHEKETASRFRTDARFPGQRIFQTGDLVRLGSGAVEFIGRLDGQVKISGYRVEITEIEGVLAGLPGVAEAAVIPERKTGANILVAFVVMRPGETFRPDALKGAMRPLLPPWKIPAKIHALDALPLTLTGKVDRRRIREANGEHLSGEEGG